MTPLQALIQFCDWRKLRWGLRAPAHRPVRLAAPGDDKFWQIDKHLVNLRTRPDEQILGSCTCNSATGVGEVRRVEAGGSVVQLDYNWLYTKISTDVHDKFKDEGLTLGQMAEGALKYVVFGPGGAFERVPNTARAICEALERGPLVIGQALHPGWKPASLNRDNGAVNEAYLKQLDPFAGHAMMLVATNVRPNGAKMLGMRQSWGPLGNEDDGLVWQTVEHFLACAIDESVLFLPGPDYGTYEYPPELLMR